MEIKKSLYNSFFGIIAIIISGLISFIKVSLIINILGQKYNGLNNLYSQIFSFLMIGEAGIGLATTTLLYKHIEKKNITEINKIISGSRELLTIILGVISLLVILVSFSIHLFIKENTLGNNYIATTFILFSFKLLFSQYFQPLKGFVAANQDEYITKIFQILLSLSVGGLEIFILYLKKSYLEMLLYGGVLSIILEILNFLYLKKKYNKIIYFFKERNYEAKNHMKELVKVNIVGTVARAVDPIIISKLIGLVMVSLYSNYNYVQSFLLTLVNAGLGGFTHYFGNVFTKKDIKRKEKFNSYIIISNFLASFFTIMFYLMIDDFISLWINPESILEQRTSFLFSLLVYIYIMMKPINTLIITNKFFKLASKSAVYETIINLTISLMLIKRIGLDGVLIGSILSFLLVSFWYFPIKAYRKVLGCSSKDYLYKQFKAVFLLMILFFLVSQILREILIKVNSWSEFIIKGITYSMICILLNLILYIIFFRESKQVLKNILKRKGE